MNIIMIGASGAVGSHCAAVLAHAPWVERLTLVNRRNLPALNASKVVQHIADPLDPSTYARLIPGHDAAICTLGVGEPSKVAKEEFVRVDKTAVLAFATACRSAGIERFTLLSAVAADARSSNHYLKTKGELEEGLKALGFERLLLFHPSMILTPQNRYGLVQGVLLKAWPAIGPLLLGPLRKYRGIKVDELGRAMALAQRETKAGVETLHHDDFKRLNAQG
jgi:uncharacterized protein YbjT (DUF2867 family)